MKLRDITTITERKHEDVTHPDFEVSVEYDGKFRKLMTNSFHSESAAKREGLDASNGKRYKVTNVATGEHKIFKDGKQVK